eukprot:g13319.t1
MATKKLAGDPHVSGGTLTTVVQSSMAGSGRTELVKKQYEREGAVIKNRKVSKEVVIQPAGLLRVVQEEVPDLSAASFQRGFKRIKENDDVRKSKKLRTVCDVAADPAKRREAIQKLDFMTDSSKRDGAKNALVARYTEVADIIDAPKGSYDSLYQFIAVSLDEFKTTSECVREVMKSEVCCMSTEEMEQMDKTLSCLKRRGYTDFPGYDTFRVAAKKIIGKEIWVLARTWADDPDAGMKVLHPVHLFAAMQTRVRGDAHEALLTLGQRDDLISRFMSAQTSMTEKDAVVICGEAFIDTQEISLDQAATTFEGRFRRWIETDLEARWREAFRRQERLAKESEARKKQQDQEDKERREREEKERRERESWFNKDRKGKGGKGGKGAHPYNGKGSKAPRHFFLDGACTFGDRCKWLHPKTEEECSRADCELICKRVKSLKVENYGMWLPQGRTPPAVPAKKD